MQLPVMPPVAPMLAKAVSEIPEAGHFEPKWDGFRSIIFRDGDEVEIGSRNRKPMTRYFPEVVAAARAHLPRRCVVDGEIVVPSAATTGLDFEALLQRVHPAESRVQLLATQTPALFVAFDLLALDDTDWMPRPFTERQAELERALRATGAGQVPPGGEQTLPSVNLTPVTTDRDQAEEWFNLFEGAGLDGLIAKRPDLTYQPDKRVMAKIKHDRTADCVVAGYRVHASGPDAVGSLLLGLFDDEGVLASVGVVGAFPMARRRELMRELAPLVTAPDAHPWSWAAQEAGTRTPHEAETSRWNRGKDLSFVPLRPELVVEVAYDHMEGARFRHTAQYRRWRPDRDPSSCTYAQLEEPVRFDVAKVLAALPREGARE